MRVVEGVICNASCFFLFQNAQKIGCLISIRCFILHYREGSFSCGGVARAIVKTSSLAKLLTGSKRRGDKTVQLHARQRVYGIFPHTSKSLVHTYPNIFKERRFFFSI